MRKTLSLFFVLALLLAGCSQNDVPATEDASLSQDNIAESNISDSNSTSETKSTTKTENSKDNDSEQPFLIEKCVHEFKNDRHSFYITIRNNSGKSIDSPSISIDFLDKNQDILCSGKIHYTGILKDGQSFMDLQSYDDFQFEFSLVKDFEYISTSAYSENGKTTSISSPQIFALS